MTELIWILGIACAGLFGVIIKLWANNMAYKAQGKAEGKEETMAECKKQMAQQSKIYNEVIKGLNEYIKSIDKPDDMSNIYLGGVSDKPD